MYGLLTLPIDIMYVSVHIYGFFSNDVYYSDVKEASFYTLLLPYNKLYIIVNTGILLLIITYCIPLHACWQPLGKYMYCNKHASLNSIYTCSYMYIITNIREKESINA